MTSLFSRPLPQLDQAAVQSLIDEQYPEGDTLELKATLPAKRAHDPWIGSQDRVGDYGRNEVLAEVVAFANAHGGNVVLGIKESSDLPHRAAGIQPLPKCVELADRLRMMARDCVEPQIPVLGVVGVPVEDDGAGVVVFRVPESRSAPHRLKPTGHCYIRRADRTEPMTMREIQDLTLQRERGTERLNAEFTARRDAFRPSEAPFPQGTPTADVVGIRATLLPVNTDLFVDDLLGAQAPAPSWVTELPGSLGQQPLQLALPSTGGNKRPVLRGVKYETSTSGYAMVHEIRSHGLVEFVMAAVVSEAWPEEAIYPSWIIGLAANAAVTAHRVREAAGAPEAEYALETEIVRTGGNLVVTGYGDFRITRRYPVETNPLIFPRMSVGPTEEMSHVLTILNRDLFNAAGVDLGDNELRIDLHQFIV